MPAELVLLEDRVGAVGGQLHLEGPAKASPVCARSCHADSGRRRRGACFARGSPACWPRPGSRSWLPQATRRSCFAASSSTRPDVAIVDIKMPPTHTDEGLVAAQELRERHPDVGVLVLSHYLESRYAMRLLEEHPERRRVSAQGARFRRRRAGRRPASCARGRVRRRPDNRLAADVPTAGQRTARRAHRARARGAGPDGRGPLQRGDLRAALPEPEDRGDPRTPDISQARTCASRPTQHRRVSAVLAFLRNPPQC